MMKLLRYFLLIVFPLFFAACADDPDPDESFPEPVDRTVLAYIAGNNNLSGFLSDNIEDMCLGMKGVGGNLIVYFASTDGNPKLYKITSEGGKTLLKTYEGQNAMDPTVLREVVNEVFESYPSNSYGLILSSHADGWTPVSDATKTRMMPEQRHPQAMITKWFGQDWSGKGASAYMNITDMAAALPVGRQLDFLLFDACFMASVEALYDLRNNAKQIIASPTEVMGNGFPYQQIVPLLFSATVDASKVAQTYVDSYRGTTYPSASVAVINTSELEALASTVRDLMAVHPDYSSLDLSAIQSFELKQYHLYYDLDDYLAQLSGKDLYYQTFQEQLSKTVEYVDCTPTIYSAYGEPAGDFFSVTHCCGLSSFIPQSDPMYTAAYWNTNWAKVITSQTSNNDEK